MAIRIIGKDGSPVTDKQYSLNGEAPMLRDGERFSLHETLSRPVFINGTPLEHIHGSAYGILIPETTGSREICFELTITSLSWDDMVALYHEIRRVVYSYKPVIHKPTPTIHQEIHAEMLQEASFLGIWGDGLVWIARAIWNDLRLVGRFFKGIGSGVIDFLEDPMLLPSDE